MRHVDLLVVLGNDAKTFYEHCGFRVRTEVMALRFEDTP